MSARRAAAPCDQGIKTSPKCQSAAAVAPNRNSQKRIDGAKAGNEADENRKQRQSDKPDPRGSSIFMPNQPQQPAQIWRIDPKSKVEPGGFSSTRTVVLLTNRYGGAGRLYGAEIRLKAAPWASCSLWSFHSRNSAGAKRSVKLMPIIAVGCGGGSKPSLCVTLGAVGPRE
jgi:hypothetical protein